MACTRTVMLLGCPVQTHLKLKMFCYSNFFVSSRIIMESCNLRIKIMARNSGHGVRTGQDVGGAVYSYIDIQL